MPSTNWLSLSDYSAKYNISMSTLRRRIRSSEVECKFDDGKYFLRDAAINKQEKVRKKIPQLTQFDNLRKTSKAESADIMSSEFSQHKDSEQMNAGPQNSNGHQKTVNQEQDQQTSINESQAALMTELKQAYIKVLQEKEEQILLLKEEIADLNTLIATLESENTRLQTKRQQPEEPSTFYSILEQP